MRDRRRYQQRVSYAPAGNAGLYARLTVRQHLAVWARLAFVPPREQTPRVEAALRAFALEPLVARRLDRLSMGQRQRVRLALAFLPGARLVLLDEPATSLDADGIAMLEAALDAHLRAGGGALWCDPFVDGAGPALADRRYVVRSGALVLA